MRSFYSWMPLALGLLAIVLTLPLVVLKATQSTTVQTFTAQAAKDKKIAVSFFPQVGSFTTGADVPVGIILESNDKPIKMVSLVVNYDPAVIDILDVAKGIIFEQYPNLSVDPSRGHIIISAANNTEIPMTGIVASFKFRAKKSGNVNFSFGGQSTGAETYNGGEYKID